MINRQSTSYLKDDIAESLILLLQKKDLNDISVREITEKAGVNRSTYYRNYKNKQDVVRHYYACLLDKYLSSISEDVSLKDYLTGMFETFIKYKKELILLDRCSLSYLLLEEMNSRVPQIHGDSEHAIQSLSAVYHVGGVFNSFRYWLHEDMASSPEKLADKCIAFLPEGFSPKLL
ncbi:MAG: TetR/AcrR family transcriptional regulator [Dorea sp.]|nr:TetR/AcrR family transcriptional regulator [Dorea sp.]